MALALSFPLLGLKLIAMGSGFWASSQSKICKIEVIYYHRRKGKVVW
jgi:hypothetical protein